MNEKENQSVETQEVAEPVQSEEMVEVAEQPASQATEEVTPTIEKPKFSEQDAAFANMRRDLEKYKNQSSKYQNENKKYKEAFQRFGFDGESSEDVLDKVNAHYYGKTVEEIRNERVANEKALRERDEMMQRLEEYEQKEIEAKMNNDLAEIKKINPDIQTLDELGEPFFDLVRRGIDGVKAYKLLEVEGLVQSKNLKVEQETIRKMKANAQASVGSLDAAASKPKSVADMSKEEFEAYRQRALRGELKSY